MTNLDTVMDLYTSGDPLYRKDDAFEDALALIPETVETFDDEFNGEAANLVRAFYQEHDDFDQHSALGGEVVRAAQALEYASQGHDPQTVTGLTGTLDRVGLRYERDTPIGAALQQPVATLGGQDWTRFTHHFKGWMGHDQLPGFTPQIVVDPLNSPIITAELAISVDNTHAESANTLYATLGNKHLGNNPYFTADPENEQGQTGTTFSFGTLKIPSPYTDEDYDHDTAVAAMNSYQNTVAHFQQSHQHMMNLADSYQQRLEQFTENYLRQQV